MTTGGSGSGSMTFQCRLVDAADETKVFVMTQIGTSSSSYITASGTGYAMLAVATNLRIICTDFGRTTTGATFQNLSIFASSLPS